MLRNYKLEEKLKEIGVKDPQQFIKNEMLENNIINDNSFKISFNFITGIILGFLITLTFIYIFL